MKEIFNIFINNWILIVIAGNFLVGSSYIISKILLGKTIGKPLTPATYVFYTGLGGFFLLVSNLFLNRWFNFLVFDWRQILLGIVAGFFLVIGFWPFYHVLNRHEASRATTLLVGSIPIFTFVLKYLFFGERLESLKVTALIFLIVGGVLVSLRKEPKQRIGLKDFSFAILSGLLFASGLILMESVFNSGGFWSGMTWLGGGYLLASIAVFLWPNQRKKITAVRNYAEKKNIFLFFSEKILSISGSTIVKFAVSLAGATLVNAFEGLKQFFVLIWAKILSRSYPKIYKEEFKGVVLWQKIIAAILIFIGIFLLIYDETSLTDVNRKITWGVTFSSKFSKQLNVDWQETFRAILNDLKPDKVRIVAYWEDIEKNKGAFDFSDLDWQMNELKGKEIGAIIVVGMKVPRWPECHLPDWSRNLSSGEREETLRAYMKKVVERYKIYSSLESWQVENEPFLWFGECPGREEDYLAKEVDLVKSLDPKRPVIVTDSGELGLWYKAIKFGDIFGTTMYRRVHSDTFHYIDYHLPPNFFFLKEKLARFATGEYRKKFIVMELAAEPWQEKQLWETPISDHFKYFDYEFFKDTIRYAKLTGFDEYYFWGAEWWYFLKTEGYSQIWDEAKKLW